jgi:hypothetical protein
MVGDEVIGFEHLRELGHLYEMIMIKSYEHNSSERI